MRILSIGFVRELWLPPEETPGDTPARLAYYASQVEAYHVLVPTRARGITGRRAIGETGWAQAITGRTPADLVLRTMAMAIQEGRRMRADLVQAQDPVYSGVPAAIAARVLGVPLNVCVYGSNPFDPNWVATSLGNRLTAPLARWVLRGADGVQADGSATVRALVAAGISADRVALKPMIPVNIDAFFAAAPDPAVRAEIVDEQDGPVLLGLFVGRFVAQKHLDLLVDVLDRTRASLPHLRIALVGEGAEQARVEALARERGVAGRMVWLGPRGHGALPGMMAACDVFLLPSNYEGFARVLMEAAAAAMPIVTTRVSGADDAVVDGETGHIVPVGDAGAMVAALERLAGSAPAARRMGAAARDHLRTVAARYGDLGAQLDIWRTLLRRTS